MGFLVSGIDVIVTMMYVCQIAFLTAPAGNAEMMVVEVHAVHAHPEPAQMASVFQAAQTNALLLDQYVFPYKTQEFAAVMMETIA